MIRALQNLLQHYQGKDVLAFRQGPFRLYIWNSESQQHDSYDPSYEPELPKQGLSKKQYKYQLDSRATFLSRKSQAHRDSF